MSEPVFDIVEDILVRLDAEDLIRCKSICKSWLSFISSSRFVNTHREYNHNNPELGHRRIIMSTYLNTLDDGKVLAFDEYSYNMWCIVGSCNGLVCFSASSRNSQAIVTNPLTRKVKKLPTAPQISKDLLRSSLCWGFGYDSFTDDYKVVMGTRMGKTRSLFRVLTLKSNLWKVTREVNWGIEYQPLGILWNGALHWFMKDCNSKKVILSFDLSREEFKEFPQPDDTRYVCNYANSLGTAEGCLCIYRKYPPYQRWVVKSNNDKQSWELLRDDCVMNTHDIAHALIKSDNPHSNWYLSSNEDDKFFSNIGKYIRCPIYVQSLVSPHLNENPKKKRQTNSKQTDKAVSNKRTDKGVPNKQTDKAVSNKRTDKGVPNKQTDSNKRTNNLKMNGKIRWNKYFGI